MKVVQLREVQRAVTLLDAMGCKFKIITDDGEEFGTLEVKAKVKRQAHRRFSHGEIRAFYKEQFNLEARIGEVQEISFGKFEPKDIQSGLGSWLSGKWGKGTYTTHAGPNSVEVMRTSMPAQLGEIIND
jgi:hypothetical protein